MFLYQWELSVSLHTAALLTFWSLFPLFDDGDEQTDAVHLNDLWTDNELSLRFLLTVSSFPQLTLCTSETLNWMEVSSESSTACMRKQHIVILKNLEKSICSHQLSTVRPESWNCFLKETQMHKTTLVQKSNYDQLEIISYQLLQNWAGQTTLTMDLVLVWTDQPATSCLRTELGLFFQQGSIYIALPALKLTSCACVNVPDYTSTSER